MQSCPWVGSTHGLGWVGLGWAGLGWVVSRFFLAFWWVGLGSGSETFLKILKLVTAEVIPDKVIMINTNKLSLTVIYYNCLLYCVRRFVIGCMDFDLVMGCGLGWVGLWVQSFYFAMGWVGLKKLDSWTTLH